MGAAARWRWALGRLRCPSPAEKPRRPAAPAPTPAPQVDTSPASASPASISLGPLDFGPGSEHRAFVAVPPGATWAELTLRAGAYDTPCMLLVRATQLQQESR